MTVKSEGYFSDGKLYLEKRARPDPVTISALITHGRAGGRVRSHLNLFRSSRAVLHADIRSGQRGLLCRVSEEHLFLS